MKRQVCFLTLLSLFLTTLPLPAAVKTNSEAPEFNLKAHDGKNYKLSDLKGKYVILEWWNKDCPFVRKLYDSGKMQELQTKYTGQGALWFTVLSSAPKKQGYLSAAEIPSVLKKEKAAPTAVLLDPDGRVGRLYGAKTTPHMYIINPKGTLVYQGAIDDKPSTDTDDIKTAKNYVELAMAASKAGKAIESDTTKPYGCSVKY